MPTATWRVPPPTSRPTSRHSSPAGSPPPSAPVRTARASCPRPVPRRLADGLHADSTCRARLGPCRRCGSACTATARASACSHTRRSTRASGRRRWSRWSSPNGCSRTTAPDAEDAAVAAQRRHLRRPRHQPGRRELLVQRLQLPAQEHARLVRRLATATRGYRDYWGVDVNRNYAVGSIFDGYVGASHNCLSEVVGRAGTSCPSRRAATSSRWRGASEHQVRDERALLRRVLHVAARCVQGGGPDHPAAPDHRAVGAVPGLRPSTSCRRSRASAAR